MDCGWPYSGSKAAAKRVVIAKPDTFVIEATPEMFVEAMHKAHGMAVPWLYIGSETDDRVHFQRGWMAVALGQYARDGQHRHGNT